MPVFFTLPKYMSSVTQTSGLPYLPAPGTVCKAELGVSESLNESPQNGTSPSTKYSKFWV